MAVTVAMAAEVAVATLIFLNDQAQFSRSITDRKRDKMIFEEFAGWSEKISQENVCRI